MMRFAHRIVCLWAISLATIGQADTITAAHYIDPTDRYNHAILGDALEWGGLYLTRDNAPDITITLPLSRVFEDVAPRLAAVDNDGTAEVITVESDVTKGARLAIYDATGLVAATPFIGRKNRWLAPVAVADLDDDGFIEIAYVDRPHLAKTLKIWRFKNNRLTFVQDVPNLTNHKIGWPYILGGLRHCPQSTPELILSNANWTTAMRVYFNGHRYVSEKIEPLQNEADLNTHLTCS